MLGTEPELIRAYVDTGVVQIVFWPVLNHGGPSIYATVAFECIGRQDIAAAWEAHDLLFENQNDLWGADMQYFVDLAQQVGVDGALFSTCYTSQETLDFVKGLDQVRQERGILGQPIFDIDGQGVLLGSQPFEVFADVIKQVQEN